MLIRLNGHFLLLIGCLGADETGFWEGCGHPANAGVAPQVSGVV